MSHRRAPTPRDVSIVVPVGPDAPHLSRCLESLTRLDPAPLEIIGVLDRSDRPDVVWPEGVRILPRGRSDGPATARNEGASASRGSILFFLDSDVTVPPDLVARVVEAFEAGGEVAAIIGSYDDEPSDPGFLSQYRNLLHHFVHQTSERDAFTFWGACGAVRRDAFLDVGGFDPRFRTPSIEDIELGYRLRARGYRTVLASELQVKHWKRWTLIPMLKTDVFRRGVPWVRLALRCGFRNDLNLRTRDRACVLLVAGLAPALLWAPWPVSLLMLAVVLALDASLYRFMAERRGVAFSAAVVPWRLLFHLYCGVSVALALVLPAPKYPIPSKLP